MNSLQNKRRKFSHDEVEKPEDPVDNLKDATTLYVGNLYVMNDRLCQVHANSTVLSTPPKSRSTNYLPSERKQPNALSTSTKLTEYRCGEIKRLVMGLDRYNKTPCGFCFVEYYTHQDALDCLKYIGGTKLDERIIRTDLDPGFEEGRQYGYVDDRVSQRCRLLTLVDVVNRVVRSATSTARNTTLAVVAMDVPMRMTSDDGRKRSTARVSKRGRQTYSGWRKNGVFICTIYFYHC